MRAWVIMLLIVIACSHIVMAQAEMSRAHLEGVPEFYYDLVNVASNQPGKTRLNVYIEIPYDELQFVKTDSGYRAEYEVTVVIYDKDGDQVDGKIWQESVDVFDYGLTNSRKHYSLSHVAFHLEPDDVRISIGLMDLESEKTGFRKNRLKLKDFSDKKIAISDITFTDQVEIDSLGIKSIHPQVADHIKASGAQLYCYFEIYSQEVKKNQTYEISYKLINAKNKKIEEQKYLRRKDAKRTMEYFTFDRKGLIHGRYTLVVKVKDGRRSDTVKKQFIIRWSGAPTTMADLDLAIEQLKYIAKGKEMKAIKKAPADEKLQQFIEFWQDRDPSPGTEKNELMDEYYKRIEYANLNYSGFREGWKTDMGMIYIIFGPPSDIERHPFERDYKPYEIWYYYNINRQFIFIDETGFGEYRLSNPYYWRNWTDGIYY